MQRNRVNRTKPISKAQKERDRAIREKFAHKPSQAEIQATGKYLPIVKQGEVLAVMQFATSLKSVREALHLSLADLADRSGIDKSAISRLENGQAENPTIGTLERLARSLGKRIKIEMEDDRPNR